MLSVYRTRLKTTTSSPVTVQNPFQGLSETTLCMPAAFKTAACRWVVASQQPRLLQCLSAHNLILILLPSDNKISLHSHAGAVLRQKPVNVA